jgi:hypothetical protein
MVNYELLTDVTQGAFEVSASKNGNLEINSKFHLNSTDFIGGYSCLTPSGLKLTPTG